MGEGGGGVVGMVLLEEGSVIVSVVVFAVVVATAATVVVVVVLQPLLLVLGVVVVCVFGVGLARTNHASQSAGLNGSVLRSLRDPEGWDNVRRGLNTPGGGGWGSLGVITNAVDSGVVFPSLLG